MRRKAGGPFRVIVGKENLSVGGSPEIYDLVSKPDKPVESALACYTTQPFPPRNKIACCPASPAEELAYAERARNKTTHQLWAAIDCPRSGAPLAAHIRQHVVLRRPAAVIGIAVFHPHACVRVTPCYRCAGTSSGRWIAMSDSVLAAIIAGTATLSASFLQLRSALLREATRGQSATRRKNRLQLMILLVVVGAAAVCGFALSQWLTSGERLAQKGLQQELQARVAEISRTASQLELTGNSARAEIEADVLRAIGRDGVAVTATVAACRVALAVSTPGSDLAPGASAETPAPAAHVCTEAEASPVTLCATVPAAAKVTEVELFSRPVDTDVPWGSNRFVAGQESGQARFAQQYVQHAPEAGSQLVCQTFTHWSVDHARVVRVVVRYSL